GLALQVARREAMAFARVNTPKGSGYALAMVNWLRDHGFGEIDHQNRYWAMRMADNAEAIAAWRKALPEAKRLKFATPHGIVAGWERSLDPPTKSGHNVSHKTGRPHSRPKGAPI